MDHDPPAAQSRLSRIALAVMMGLAAGTFGGLVGLGGGAVLVPLLVRMARQSHLRAHGTSLSVVVFTGLVGSLSYGLRGHVDVHAAGWLATTGMLFAPLGSRLAHSWPERRLRRGFGLFLLGICALLLAKPFLLRAGGAPFAAGWAKALTLLSVGVCVGMIAGLMGVGGASLSVPAMVLLIGMSQHTAQGSALLAIVPAAGAAAWSHARRGNVAWELAPWLIGGVMAGSFAGSSLALLLPDVLLRLVFATVLVWIGARQLR